MLCPAVTPNHLAQVDDGLWKGEFGRVVARSQDIATWRHIQTGTELDFHVSKLIALVPVTGSMAAPSNPEEGARV